ncbi:MAG: hypothetical protein WBA43_15895 [Elainellaceae cyanobacterium]
MAHLIPRLGLAAAIAPPAALKRTPRGASSTVIRPLGVVHITFFLNESDRYRLAIGAGILSVRDTWILPRDRLAVVSYPL